MWVRKWWDLLTDQSQPVCYLDEKWFCITNRRRKIERLPLGDGEAPGSDFIPAPKMRSRRFPVKSMFMGVVAKPQAEKGFNGGIHLERISVRDKVTKKSAHQRFSDDRNLNNEIKQGEWRKLLPPNSQMTTRELAEIIGELYNLERAVTDRLKFSYVTYVGSVGNAKTVAFDNHQSISGLRRIAANPQTPSVPITVEDVSLKVRLIVGDVMERDCSCDSKCMLEAMDRVGESV